MKGEKTARSALILGVLLIGAPALAGEPLVLDEEQMDQVTAGSVTQVVIFTPNQPPRQVGCECLNLFADHPAPSPDVFVNVRPGVWALHQNPGQSDPIP